MCREIIDYGDRAAATGSFVLDEEIAYPSGVPAKQLSSEQKRLLAKLDLMIAGAEAVGFEQAAANLIHWREGTGTVRVMPSGAFLSEQFVLDELNNRHFNAIAAEAIQKVRQGLLTVGSIELISVSFTVYSPSLTDLYFALGGFTMTSKAIVRIGEGEEGVSDYTVNIDSWDIKVTDEYDWDPGKLAKIPGIGVVKDSDMAALEAAGFGKSFPVISQLNGFASRAKQTMIVIPKSK